MLRSFEAAEREENLWDSDSTNRTYIYIYICVCVCYIVNYLFYFDGHHLRQIENQTNVRSVVNSMTIYVLMGDGGFGVGNEDEDEDDVFVEIWMSGYLKKLEMARNSKHKKHVL